MEPSRTAAPVRIPSLDGLRALSIALVMLGHLAGTRGFPRGIPRLAASAYATFGVRVFFVISGLLITTLLVEESRRHGAISIPHFYLRRTFRIFPAFYALLAVVCVLDGAGVIALRPGDALAAFTYTMNYHPARSWWVGHLWSLSVEEQFYLVWPALLRLAGLRGGLVVALGALAIAPAIRVATLIYRPDQALSVGETFQTAFDALAAGCVLAMVRESLGRSPRYLSMLRSPWFALVPLVALATPLGEEHARLDALFGESVCVAAVALSIDRVVRFQDDPIGRLLNSRPLIYVGGLSYSLYLWQQLFMARDSPSPLERFPLNLALAIGAAILSQRLIERPFLSLRVRVEKRLLPAR